MPFGTITVNSKTFEPRSPGYYSLDTVVFGQPSNEIRIRGAGKSSDKLLRCSITRVLEKDVVVGSDTVRKQATVVLSITTPASDFTGTEMDTLASDISEFVTASTVSRMLQGES